MKPKLDSTIIVYGFALLKNIHRHVCKVLSFCQLQFERLNKKMVTVTASVEGMWGWGTGVGDFHFKRSYNFWNVYYMHVMSAQRYKTFNSLFLTKLHFLKCLKWERPKTTLVLIQNWESVKKKTLTKTESGDQKGELLTSITGEVNYKKYGQLQTPNQESSTRKNLQDRAQQ